MAFSMISKSFESFNLHKTIHQKKIEKKIYQCHSQRDSPLFLKRCCKGQDSPSQLRAEGQSTESKEPVELAAKELRREFQVIQEVPQTVGKNHKWEDP